MTFSGLEQALKLVPTHPTAKTMKDGIHPNYREVVFLDTSSDFGFVTRSTVATNETIKWKDGKEYPVYKIEISAESHPFYRASRRSWTPPAASTNSARSTPLQAPLSRRLKRYFPSMNPCR